jgi:hypothetical protein
MLIVELERKVCVFDIHDVDYFFYYYYSTLKDFFSIVIAVFISD